MTARRRAASRAAGVLAVGLFAWWATADGGYAPGAWYPGALVLLAALVGVVRPAAYRTLPLPARWALAALVGFTVWSFCSIAWADARGVAWDGANRTLLYLMVFAFFATVPWTSGEAAAGLAAFAVATAGVGGWAFVEALAGAGETVFAEGRLAAPIGYENATAALLLMAFWAALLTAARSGTAAHERAVLLATAGLLLDLVILAQSRGSIVAGLVTLALAVAFAPDRWRLALALAAVAGVTLAALPALLALYDHAAATGTLDVAPAAVAMGSSTVLLLAAGAAFGRFERWTATRRRALRPRAVVAAVMVLSAVGLAFAVIGGPLAAPGGAAGRALDSRFAAGPGTGRYDFWRVAALEFARHPVGGVGADNFAHDYVRERRGNEEPLHPHSLAWRALAQTGAVGAALLALFLGAVVLAVRRLPRDDEARRWVAVAGLVAGAVWVAQGSIDWLWEIPAVGAPAMACLGLAAGLGPRGVGGGRPAAAGRRIAIVAAVALMAGAAGASLALPALAARDVELAVRGWSEDPAAALRRLERARGLNPLSDRPDLVAGALTLRSGDHERARLAYRAALARDGRNWHAHVELGLLELEAGRQAAAVAQLRRARELNPNEAVVDVALDAALGGAPLSPALRGRLTELAVPGPIERHPVECLPVLGLGSSCARSER